MSGYDWVYAAAGWTIGVGGGALLLWALLWDRARGRRRCPNCWYDMAGVAGLRCPECGREVRREKGLRRTRRRWVWAGAGCVAAIGAYPLAYARELREGNWLAMVPSTVLVLMFERSPDPLDVFRSRSGPPTWRDELAARYRGLGLARWQQRLVDRAEGFDPARSLATLSAPHRWPAGIPLEVHFEPGPGGWVERRVRLTPLFEGRREVDCWIADPLMQAAFVDRFLIGTPPAGPGPLRFRVELFERGRGDNDGECTLRLWSGEASIATEVGGTVDDILRPVEMPELAGWLHLWRGNTMAESVAVTLDPGHELSGLTIGLEVEIVHDGRVKATAHVLLKAERGDKPAYGNLRGDLSETASWAESDPSWSFRVRGDGVTALWDPDAKTYWRGGFTVPMSEVRWIGESGSSQQ